MPNINFKMDFCYFGSVLVSDGVYNQADVPPSAESYKIVYLTITDETC